MAAHPRETSRTTVMGSDARASLQSGVLTTTTTRSAWPAATMTALQLPQNVALLVALLLPPLCGCLRTVMAMMSATATTKL